MSAAKSQRRLRVASNCMGTPESMATRRRTFTSRQRSWTISCLSSEKTSTTNCSGEQESEDSKPKAVADWFKVEYPFLVPQEGCPPMQLLTQPGHAPCHTSANHCSRRC